MRIVFLLLFPITIWCDYLFINDEITLQPLGEATINDSLKSDQYGRVKIDSTIQNLIINKFGYKTYEISFDEAKKRKMKIFLSPSDFETEEIVVSATHWESNRQKIPVKISNIEKSKILIQNPQTAADLVGSSGEIFVQKSQLGGGSPMIRGFATNRVMITVDGVRMNNAIFRSGNLQNVISIDPNMVENTELVFGPGSVLYGSDAIGGVMNFHTLDPKLASNKNNEIEYSGNLRYSSANKERNINLTIRDEGEYFSYLVSGGGSIFGDQIMGSNGPDEYLRNQFVRTNNGNDTLIQNSNPEEQVGTGYRQGNFLMKVLLKASEKLQLKASYYRSETNNIPRYDRLIRPRNEILRSAEWYYGPQKWDFANFTAYYKSPTKYYDEIKFIAAYQKYEESRNDRNFGNTILEQTRERVDIYSANLDFYKQNEKSNIYYGIEYVLNNISSEANTLDVSTGIKDNLQTRYPDGSNWQSMAAYGNIKYDLTSSFSIFSGLRLNYIGLNASFDTTFLPLPFTETSLNNFAVNGSAGFAYRPVSDFQFNGNISTGFRSPNIDDIGKVFDSTPGSVVIPNNDIAPEYAYNFELSIEKSFWEYFKFDITGYYTILTNAMVRSNFSLNGSDSLFYDGEMSNIQAVQNVEDARVYGLQVYSELKLPLNFAISSRYNFQVGERKTKDGTTLPLRHAAPNFGKTVLKYFWNSLRLEFFAIYSSEFTNSELDPDEQDKDYLYAKDENGLPYSPSWYTLNFKGLYRFNKYFLFTFGIENITDQRYRPYSSGIAAPGINFIGGVQINY